PIGQTVHASEATLLNDLHVSPEGHRLAFKDFEDLFLLDPGGQARKPPGESWAWNVDWSTATGVWGEGHSALDVGTTYMAATSASGGERVLARMPGDFILYDVFPDGSALLGRIFETEEILGSFPGEPKERNLSHLTSSETVALSASGDAVYFNEGALIESPEAFYVRRTAEGLPKRLRDGLFGYAISPDGSLAVASGVPGQPTTLRLVPTGPGPVKLLDSAGISPESLELDRTRFAPDGRSIVFTGRAAGRPPRTWMLKLDGGKPRALTPEDVRRPVLTGDGRFVCAR